MSFKHGIFLIHNHYEPVILIEGYFFFSTPCLLTEVHASQANLLKIHDLQFPGLDKLSTTVSSFSSFFSSFVAGYVNFLRQEPRLEIKYKERRLQCSLNINCSLRECFIFKIKSLSIFRKWNINKVIGLICH